MISVVMAAALGLGGGPSAFNDPKILFNPPTFKIGSENVRFF